MSTEYQKPHLSHVDDDVAMLSVAVHNSVFLIPQLEYA
jgi:hypothetical protein